MMKTENTQPTRPTGFVRVPEILSQYLPISRSLFWAKVKSGDFPKPIKLSSRVSAWKRADIEALCTRLAGEVSQ
jgi:prophage regulatory protein